MLKKVALLLLVSFLIAGCATEDTEGDTNGESGEQPMDTGYAKEIIIGAEDDGYEIEGDDSRLGQYPLNVNITETLVKLAADYSVEPVLATDWEYKGDNRWRFYLRQGVKFHNGDEFTAEDVEFSLKRIARRGSGALSIDEESVTIVDDYTVDITTTEPNMRLVEALTHPGNGIVAADTELGKEPVGTGPFKFVSYRQSEEIIVERNDNYWGQPAKAESLTFKFIPDNNTRIMALQAGEVDLIMRVPRESSQMLQDTEGLQVLTSNAGSYSAIYLNLRDYEPYDLLAEKDLRLALALAVDRESIVERIWDDNAELNQTVIPPNILGEHRQKVEGFSYDQQKAKEILEKSGWVEGPDGVRERDGRKLELTLVSGFPSAEVHKPLPEVLQAQLKEVGVDLKITEIGDTGSYQDMLSDGEGDLWLEAGSQNMADPTFLPYLLFHSQGFYSVRSNELFAPGEKFDNLIDQARAAEDLNESVIKTAEAMHVLIDEEYAVIPIASIFNIFATKDSVGGFTPHPSRINSDWSGIYMED